MYTSSHMKAKVVHALKHLFIPHHENEYKPHFFREVAVSVMLFVSVFLLGSSFGSSFVLHKTVLGAEIASSVLIDLTNESRIQSNERPLIKNDKLALAAQLKGEDMVSKEYFSHNSPEGVTPWHWFKEAGYTFLYAGENLAINFTDSEEVEKAWLNSPKHRANILNGEFSEIGIATISGMYNNYPTIYIVQMFGTPAYAEILKTNTVETKSSSKKKTPMTSLSTTTSLTNGDVQGDSASGVGMLMPVQSQGDMLIVKNTAALGGLDVEQGVPVYSAWYERFLFNNSRYVDVFYKIMLVVIALALVLMIVIEIRKQHVTHIIIGASLLFILSIFTYINQSFF